MENEFDNTNIFDKNNSEFNYLFYLDYVGQNLDNNIHFQKWKKSILNKMGKNSKLFLCIKDKILFYIKYEKYINYPGYLVRCPICKKYICYFCSHSSYEVNNIKCCIRRSLYIALFIDAPNFVKNEFVNYSFNYKESLIPGFNLINIFLRINNIIFCTVATKKSKNDKNGKLKVSEKIENEAFDRCIYLIPFSLIIPFFIINTYFIITIILISITINDYPLKYYYGFLDEK